MQRAVPQGRPVASGSMSEAAPSAAAAAAAGVLAGLPEAGAAAGSHLVPVKCRSTGFGDDNFDTFGTFDTKNSRLVS